MQPVVNEVPEFDDDWRSASWKKQKKHVFIMSNAGKPIYTRLWKCQCHLESSMSFFVSSLALSAQSIFCLYGFHFTNIVGDDRTLTPVKCVTGRYNR